MNNKIKISVLEKEPFMFGVTSVMDMCDKYIKIGGTIYFAKRINDFADLVLMKISYDNDYENIGNIFPVNKRSFKICFFYEGFAVDHRIKFSQVKAY